MDKVRAWKDAGYRASLSADELGALPANPAGQASLRSLSDVELDEVAAAGAAQIGTLACCWPTFTPSINTMGTLCLLTCVV